MIVDGMQSTFGRKPQIKGVPDNIDYYDEIILGTPIWAGMPAAPVYTFIKKYGIADKIDAVLKPLTVQVSSMVSGFLL